MSQFGTYFTRKKFTHFNFNIFWVHRNYKDETITKLPNVIYSEDKRRTK